MYPYFFRIQCNLLIPGTVFSVTLLLWLYCVEVRSSEPMHTVCLLFHQIYLKDVFRWNICIPPVPSYNSQSHIVLTLITLCVSCLYRTLICPLRGLCLYSEIQWQQSTKTHLWLNIHPHKYTLMYIHSDMEKRRVDLAQARSLMQPHRTRSDAKQSTHLKLTVHVCQTFLSCHRTQSLYLFFLSHPSLKSQSICLFSENVWEAGRIKWWESLFD